MKSKIYNKVNEHALRLNTMINECDTELDYMQKNNLKHLSDYNNTKVRKSELTSLVNLVNLFSNITARSKQVQFIDTDSSKVWETYTGKKIEFKKFLFTLIDEHKEPKIYDKQISRIKKIDSDILIGFSGDFNHFAITLPTYIFKDEDIDKYVLPILKTIKNINQ